MNYKNMQQFIDTINDIVMTSELKELAWLLVASRLQGSEFETVRQELLKRFDEIKELDNM